MSSKARNWRVVAGGAVAGIAGVVGIAGGAAHAEPLQPVPPAPVPSPVATAQPGLPTVAQPATTDPTGLGVIPSSTPSPLTSGSQLHHTSLQPAFAKPTLPLVPATSGTLRDYFAAKGVALEPQDPREFRALQITLPMPVGWSQVPDPNVPDAYAVIADRVGGDALYTSNAQVVIYRLVGDFDPYEAITHGYVDSQQLKNWQTTDASLEDFGGFPSALIEGMYVENDIPLNTSRRHVIASSGTDRYLVSMAVTTAASHAVASAEATDAIVNGFRVTDPARATTQTPGPVPGLTGATAAPALPGLPAQTPAVAAPAAVATPTAVTSPVVTGLPMTVTPTGQ